MRRVLLQAAVIVQFVACSPADDVGTPPLVRGPQTQDSGEDDPGEKPKDSDEPVDSEEPKDSDEPVPSGQQACYLGPERDGQVCLDLVDYDPSWGSDYAYPEPYNGSSQYREPLRYVDLSVWDEDMKLAPNFVLSEFMAEYKGRYGVYQTHVVEHLQDIRDETGGAITVNSGYRNVSYNAGVGGASSSRHIYGDAVDMRSSVVSLAQLGEICDAHGAGYVGYYDSHVHCDWRGDALDPAFYGGERQALSLELPELDAELIWQGGELLAPATGWDEGEPLREWTAWDAQGRILAFERGRSFTPPEQTARVQVLIGRELIREVNIPQR